MKPDWEMPELSEQERIELERHITKLMEDKALETALSNVVLHQQAALKLMLKAAQQMNEDIERLKVQVEDLESEVRRLKVFG